MKIRNIAEALIYNKKKEILMQKKTIDYPVVPGGIWCFFGGEVEENEKAEETLIREIEEETGIKVNEKDVELLDVLDYELETGYKGKQFVFKVKFNGDLSDIRLGEGAGFCFFDKSEIESYNALIPDMCKNSLKIFWGSFES